MWFMTLWVCGIMCACVFLYITVGIHYVQATYVARILQKRHVSSQILPRYVSLKFFILKKKINVWYSWEGYSCDTFWTCQTPRSTWNPPKSKGAPSESSNMGGNSCQKVTVNVLLQLKGEKERVDTLIESSKPRKIPVSTDGSGQVQEK